MDRKNNATFVAAMPITNSDNLGKKAKDMLCSTKKKVLSSFSAVLEGTKELQVTDKGEIKDSHIEDKKNSTRHQDLNSSGPSATSVKKMLPLSPEEVCT